MSTNNTKYSLAYLEQLKAEKSSELEKTKENIVDLTHAIMAPPVVNNNMELWMHYASNGMTAYRGLMTGIRLFKRLKSTFAKKKKTKKLF